MRAFLKKLLATLVLGTALFTQDAVAQTGCPGPLNVCYYDLLGLAGDPDQVPPIVTAGHAPVDLTALDAAHLIGCDVLFVQNPSNTGYSVDWGDNLGNVTDAVQSGAVLVFHDRWVTEASANIPGLEATSCFRDFADGADIDVVTTGTSVTDGPGGIVDNTTLDGGNSSSHGFCTEGTLPAAGPLNVLSRSDPAEAVTFSFDFGAGAVVYSTIPLDFYLNLGTLPGFSGVYAPNVVQYAADLFCESASFDNGRLVYLGLDATDSRHGSQAEAPILSGNAARWAGRSDDPRIGFVEGGGEFMTEVGARLAAAGLTHLTEIDASLLAATDLSGFDVLYLGPTTEVDDYVAAGANISSFGGLGGGLVVEPNVFDPLSWSWVPFARQIGHSGVTNVASESVAIVDPNHPVMNGLTAGGLSNWGTSVHSSFLTPEAVGFEVLAIDRPQIGVPVIIAREAPGFIFADGFESGDTTTWTVTVP